MKAILSRRKIVPIATALMALVLVGCVDEGRYYHADNGYRDYRRDGGRIAPPPPRYDYGRDYRGDRRGPPPRRDYDRAPPSIYDDRGRGDDHRRYGDGRRDRHDPRRPVPPRYQPPHTERGAVSIYQYSR